MIPSNISVSMSADDIHRFLSEMDRKCKGVFSDVERQRIIKQNFIYKELLKKNGGINPLFRR